LPHPPQHRSALHFSSIGSWQHDGPTLGADAAVAREPQFPLRHDGPAAATPNNTASGVVATAPKNRGRKWLNFAVILSLLRFMPPFGSSQTWIFRQPWFGAPLTVTY
jgi:hypothetical protein